MIRKLLYLAALRTSYFISSLLVILTTLSQILQNNDTLIYLNTACYLGTTEQVTIAFSNKLRKK